MKLERIQRAASKMSSSLADLTYEERLERLGLTTLEERRKRGDLITVYKYIQEIEGTDRENFLARDEGELRGHDLKLKKTRCRKDIKKYSFPYRCVDDWNRLHREITEAVSIHSFKVKLDKYRHGGRTVRA
ncbi:MAG: hypothetical protein GY782_05260 [Gammaproteobacteria bacterium]|nr:hypothetical protein [Gammaproteobacteria bacterium]